MIEPECYCIDCQIEVEQAAREVCTIEPECRCVLCTEEPYELVL